MELAVRIAGVGSISCAGCTAQEVRTYYSGASPHFVDRSFSDRSYPVGAISAQGEVVLSGLLLAHRELRKVDRVAYLSVYAARCALESAGWSGERLIGVNIGSSRGATATFEDAHSQFLESPDVRLAPTTSPVTTLGNISSMVSTLLELDGVSFSHSVTCSTALHAVANGVAWIRAGMARRFLVGGSEAPLTAFTLAQMEALKLYTEIPSTDFPCRPFETTRSNRNSLVLGEGASVLALEGVPYEELSPGDIVIDDIGFATERAQSLTGIDERGDALYRAMRGAIDSRVAMTPIDLVVAHAPGTILGDRAELTAIHDLFGGVAPRITSNKWLIGHTFGASGALSLEFALQILRGMPRPKMPFWATEDPQHDPRTVLVNATGFGGNAVSVVVSRIDNPKDIPMPCRQG